MPGHFKVDDLKIFGRISAKIIHEAVLQAGVRGDLLLTMISGENSSEDLTAVHTFQYGVENYEVVH